MENYQENISIQVTCLFIIFLYIGLSYFIIRKERDQIRDDIEKRGGKLISKELILVAHYPLLKKRMSYYKVCYIDPEGKEHMAKCKPGLLGGAFWSDDTIITEKVSVKKKPKK